MANGIFDVIIIGGGASGLFLAARLKSDLNVAIVESGQRVGKKLLSTGNGKCNLTNRNLSPDKYNNPNFVKSILKNCDFYKTLQIFDEMGLAVKETDGKIYPYSECSESVLDVLRREAERKNVTVFSECQVSGIKKSDGVFTVFGDKSKAFSLRAKNVVLASGFNATFGQDSTSLFTALGHSVRSPKPSLGPIITEKERIKGLSGVRVKAKATLKNCTETGEILFKDFGLSGIAIFNLSKEIARGNASCKECVHIDFMPEYSLTEVAKTLIVRYLRIVKRNAENLVLSEKLQAIEMNRKESIIKNADFCNTLKNRGKTPPFSGNFDVITDETPDLSELQREFSAFLKLNKSSVEKNPVTFNELLQGTFHTRIKERLVEFIGWRLDGEVKDNIFKLAIAIKDYPIATVALSSFSLAQAVSGGLNVDEFDENLQSKITPCAYAVGEVLDVDGECGGYNLQWAWSSAETVANAINGKGKI